MATIGRSDSNPIDNTIIDLSDVNVLPLTLHLNNSLTWSDGAGDAIVLQGSFVPVVNANGTELITITSGTIDEVQIYSGGDTLTILGFSADAPNFSNLLSLQDWGGLAKAIFAGNDQLSGTFLDDTLDGFGGNDYLIGGNGNDKLIGGSGNDTLYSFVGDDTMTGGSGMDTFIFDNPDPGDGVLTIKDFRHGVDHLELVPVFGNIGAAGVLDPSHFHRGTAATTSAQGIIYDKATGNLWADADGTGPAAAVLIAHFGAGTVVTSSDFLVS